MRLFLICLLLGCLVGCSTTHSSGSGKILRYPNRTFADWQPDKAVAEAQHDIAAGTPKIYVSGTVVIRPPGISSAQIPIIKDLPEAAAGVGCDVEDAKLRHEQFEYARRYNEYIVQHLSKR